MILLHSDILMNFRAFLHTSCKCVLFLMQKSNKMMPKTFNINVTRNQKIHTQNIPELEKKIYDTFPSYSLRNKNIHVKTIG